MPACHFNMVATTQGCQEAPPVAIHPSAWKMTSRKSISTILHSPGPTPMSTLGSDWPPLQADLLVHPSVCMLGSYYKHARKEGARCHVHHARRCLVRVRGY